MKRPPKQGGDRAAPRRSRSRGKKSPTFRPCRCGWVHFSATIRSCRKCRCFHRLLRHHLDRCRECSDACCRIAPRTSNGLGHLDAQKCTDHLGCISRGRSSADTDPVRTVGHCKVSASSTWATPETDHAASRPSCVAVCRLALGCDVRFWCIVAGEAAREMLPSFVATHKQGRHSKMRRNKRQKISQRVAGGSSVDPVWRKKIRVVGIHNSRDSNANVPRFNLGSLDCWLVDDCHG